MKRRLFFLIASLLLMLAGVQTVYAQKMVVTTMDNQVVKFDVSNVRDVTFEEGEPPVIIDDHECVDLGLPSGTLWATCNVGADSPEDYGDYFAWGETTPKSSYSWGTYKWMTEGQADWSWISKYTFADGQTVACWYSGETFIGDGKKELLPEDDAAKANWGDKWQMPSKEQFQELVDKNYTTTEWTTQEGVYGRKITSKENGNSIFLPAAGYFGTSGAGGVGSRGSYWSRTLSTFSNNAIEMFFGSSTISYSGSYRYTGANVRPVRIEGGTSTKLVTSIVLNYPSLTMKPNEAKQLTATVYPPDADNKTVTWESSNTAMATVSAGGMVTAKADGSCRVICSATDGSGVKAECLVTVGDFTPGNHEYVDLGLSHGTLWATCNIGANSPEDYGDYFAWGETEPKSVYSWETYKWCVGPPIDPPVYSNNLTKYCNNGEYLGYNGFEDNLEELLPEDDAATMNWGSEWQMPTYEQIDELYDECSYEWTQRNGVNGVLVTGPNGNQIFLPAAGQYVDDVLGIDGSYGYYLSNSQARSGFVDKRIHGLTFREDDWRIDDYDSALSRWTGCSVRPVRKQ